MKDIIGQKGCAKGVTKADEGGSIAANNANALGCLVADERQEQSNASAHCARQRLWQEPV